MTITIPKEMLHDILKMKVYNGVPEYALKNIKGVRRYMASWLKHSMNFTLGVTEWRQSRRKHYLLQS